MGTTLLYLDYFLQRNRFFSKDNFNRFPTNYIDDLRGLTQQPACLHPSKVGVWLQRAFTRCRKPEDVARSGIALVPEGRRIFADLTPLRGMSLTRLDAGGNPGIDDLAPLAGLDMSWA